MKYTTSYLKELISAALNRKGSLVIKNVSLVNVITREIEDNMNILIYKDRIVGVFEDRDFQANQIIDGKGLYAVPGFIDPHMHIESSYLTPEAFANIVLPLGTTTVFADPHEVVNSCGIEGLKLFNIKTQLKIFITFPSCVPPKPEFEDSTFISTFDFNDSRVIALGEVMDFDSVIKGDDRLISEIAYFLNENKIIEGHAPGLSGDRLNAYLSAGITSDHQCTTASEALEKLRRGMYIFVRESSISKNLKNAIKIITENKVDDTFVSLCTDDVTARDLILKGHLNYVIKRAIEEGVDPVLAYKLATLNPAIHYNMQNILGSISPFRFADIVLIKDLRDPKPYLVIANGEIASKSSKTSLDYVNFTHSISIAHVNESIFKIPDGHYKANIIKVIDRTSHTEHVVREVDINEGEVITEGINKVSVIHRRGKGYSLGLVEGFNVKGGAVSTSFSHDTHNIVVVGSDSKSMALAVNKLIDNQGGFVAVKEGTVIAELKLPICGILSNDTYDVINSEDKLISAWRELGSKLENPSVNLSSLTLTVIPKIRITNRGLIDTEKYKKIDLFIQDEYP